MSTNQPPYSEEGNQPGSPLHKNNFFGKHNALSSSAPNIEPYNSFQPTNDQARWPNQGAENPPNAGQSDYARGTTTGQLSPPATGTLMQPMGEYSGNTGMLKLNQAVKVVRMLVAGRPGEFKTGILPILPQSQTGALPPSTNNTFLNKPKNNFKLIALVGSLIFLVLLGSGGYYLLYSHSASPSTSKSTQYTSSTSKANIQATSTIMAQATATSVANATLFSDSLSYNIHDWSTGDVNSTTFTFTNGAYHIRADNNSPYLGYTYVIPSNIPKSYIYNLTMRNISYNASDTNNLSFYGMIFNYKYYSKGTATFYIFRVNNGVNGGKNITYELDKFDSVHNHDNPYAQLFPDPNNHAGDGKGNGKEFHGQSQPNTYSVEDNNGNFTLRVNGTKIGTVKDTSLAIGGFGMGVNQAKSEAAFSDLSILSN
jgi:hypothetical protein